MIFTIVEAVVKKIHNSSLQDKVAIGDRDMSLELIVYKRRLHFALPHMKTSNKSQIGNKWMKLMGRSRVSIPAEKLEVGWSCCQRDPW